MRARVENLKAWLEGLNTFNSTPNEGTTRVLFTQPELEARTYIKQEMRQIGLEVSEDAIGNIFGVLPGRNRALTPVWTGSHIDTVLNAGMFDGMAGVVGGMEAARMIRESGAAHERDICVVVYTSEEPTRFGLSCLGSRAMSGNMSLEDTKRIVSEGGGSLYETLSSLGYDLNCYGKIRKHPGDVYCAVEMHIEQNNRLDKSGVKLGVVSCICAPSVYSVTLRGQQGHAGGTSMQERRDAFMALCEIALTAERMARETVSEYTTATIGRVEVTPGAENVIPGTVEFSIDIRDCNYECKNRFMGSLESAMRAICANRGVEVEIQLRNNDCPMRCDPEIIRLLKKSCAQKGIVPLHLISGAYHDSMFVGQFTRVGMLFVPSKNGASHCPEEWTDYEDIATGTEVLADTLVQLANQ